MTKKQIALKRASELKDRIQDYLDVKERIPSGMAAAEQAKMEEKKRKILTHLKGTEENWKDYRWQLKNRISDLDTLRRFISLDPAEADAVQRVAEKYRWSISPYYLSLIDDDNTYDPIKLQAIPMVAELRDTGLTDPMAEEFTNPAGAITRRYPDRVIINVTNQCAMYCRHCQRRRNIGSDDHHTSREKLEKSIAYIRANPEIRDVLVTGGDALLLSDATLDWLIGELHAIPSIEYVRLGTRVLATMPQRVTDQLVNILKKYPPLYVNTQ